MPMTRRVWIIEPRDPFIARDGKPFGVGMSATTLPFPFPSTTTGGLRTRAGLVSGSFVDADGAANKKLIKDVKQIATSGVLLVELNHEGEIEKWLMPAPADALLLETENDEAQIKRLVPLDTDDGVTNLDQGPHQSDHLAPVGQPEFDLSKPFDRSPRFWFWEHIENWLSTPDWQPLAVTTNYLGHNGAALDARTHVAVDAESWTAKEGQLFQTRGLEFTHCEGKSLSSARRLAMGIPVAEHELVKIIDGIAPLGGERRAVMWRRSIKQLPNDCLSKIKAQVANDRACRLLLLTPAWFENGSRPGWLLNEQTGVTPKLIGIANVRAQVISGWDFEKREPKPTRRLMPAGSVFFLGLSTKANPETDPAKAKAEIEKWVEQTWMTCISDDAKDGDPNQHRNDGFGLAVIGTWDGKLRPMTFPISNQE
jgi:CRISPR-associated protein Cmr3